MSVDHQAYSHRFQEGERLAFEPKKASPALEVWVYDRPGYGCWFGATWPAN